MIYKTAFWILTFLTAISATLQILGYQFLEVLIVLLILDSIAFGAVVEIERKVSKKESETNEIISRKIEDLENVCKDVLKKVSINTAMVELEEKLNMHKAENKMSLDKLAEKTLSLEKKINRFGATLADHMGLDKSEDNEEYIYIQTEE